MTKPKLTNEEKIFIFDALNGSINKIYLIAPNSAMLPYYLNDFDRKESLSKDSLVNNILDSELLKKHPNVILSELIDKIYSFDLDEFIQLRNEVFVFWNKRELMEIHNKCRRLLELDFKN